MNNYANVPETTATGCPRQINGKHRFEWAKRPGMQECALCHAKNWVGMEDKRLQFGTVLDRQDHD